MTTIDNQAEYNAAMDRYQRVKYAVKGSPEHTEKMKLVGLIEVYELANDSLPALTDEEYKIISEQNGWKVPT